MLKEIDSRVYYHFFPDSHHPFITNDFIELNSDKAEKVVWLVPDSDKPSLGLVAGIKESMLISPFSAPFGGFHFKHDAIYTGEIDEFLQSLKTYLEDRNLTGVQIILPPDLYNMTINAKVINALIRNGYDQSLPEITCWIELEKFTGRFSQKSSREYYKKAVKNNLSFGLVEDDFSKREVYRIVKENRARFGRPIYMSYEDIMQTSELWPTDFFTVNKSDESIVASAILYRSHPETIYAVFWGDSEEGRELRAMDFLSYNLWMYYKEIGFKYIDMGTSTESGIPNSGLLRFKESHNCESSLRFKFSWYKQKES